MPMPAARAEPAARSRKTKRASISTTRAVPITAIPTMNIRNPVSWLTAAVKSSSPGKPA